MPGPEADPDPAACGDDALPAPSPAGVRTLRQPQAVHELFLFRLTLLTNTARVPVVRLCQRDYGITRREFRLLGALAGSAGVSSSALAGRMRLDRARTSRVVTSLVAKGLVQRRIAPADRRETLLQLSPRGQTTFDELLPRVAAINRELLAGLDDADLAVVDRVLGSLTARASLMGAGVGADDTDASGLSAGEGED